MDIEREGLALLHRNRRVKDGHQYTMPSPSKYPYQWLWDSCFHAIILAPREPEAAKAELRSLFAKQLPSGMIPHMLFWQPKFWPPYNWDWTRNGASEITQPPMVAYAALEIYRHTHDAAFLQEIYTRLLSFYRYFIDERDPRDHHLAGIINPDESGEDNSPRFDAALGVPTNISFYGHLYRRHKLVRKNRVCNFDAELCMSQNFWVKDVPFNTILIRNLEALGEIANVIGEKSGEHFAKVQVALMKEAMRDRLFADGVFWSARGHDYMPLCVATWAHFAPLFAGLYTKEEAEAVVREHFYDEKTFRAPFGIRTVSKREPSYRNDGFWRGPVWMAPHWFIYKGLASYGFTKEASWIRERSAALLECSGFREYFNPETGAGYGAKNFTWGTLVLDMIDES